MTIINTQKMKKTLIFSLLLSGVLLFNIMPFFAEAAILVTGTRESHDASYASVAVVDRPPHCADCTTTTTRPPHCTTTTTTRPPHCTTTTTTSTTKPPYCQTYNCNTNTWQCVEAPCGTGQYSSLTDCQANCKAPITRYSCNTNTWQCVVDPYGPYTSLSSCQTNCTSPITRYSCNTNTWQCVIDSVGPYTSLSTCQANCKAPITRYSCNTNTWQCYQDTYGPYTSLNSCQNDCKAPVTRYSCNTNTWQCYQDSYGPYTSLSSCQNDCQSSVISLNVSCYASPSSAQTYQTITFYSNVSGGTGNYSYSWSGSASGNQSYSQRSFSNPGSYTAFLTVYDSQGRSANTSCSTYVSSGSNQCPNPPTINLWADKYSVQQGETTYLRWTSSNTNYCVASNGWSNNKSTSGIETISPINNTTYTLTCYGYGNCGSVSQSVTIYTATTQTGLNLTKLGRNLSGGGRVYSKVIQVLENDVIEFHLTVSAGNNTDLYNVIVKDPLPSVLTYMPGTTKIGGITQPDTITTTGLSLGTIYQNTSKVITFQARSGSSSVYLSHTNTAEATANNQNKVTDSATVTYGLVAGAATVKTGVGNSLLISFILSLMIAFAIWYYLRFNPSGQLALATIERKTRDSYLALARYRNRK